MSCGVDPALLLSLVSGSFDVDPAVLLSGSFDVDRAVLLSGSCDTAVSLSGIWYG